MMKNKSALRLKFKKNALLLAIAALALCTWSDVALADECASTAIWTGSTGSWFVGDNWDIHRVPDSSTAAQVNNGGNAQVNSSGAEACTLTLGYDNFGLDHGAVSVNNGGLDISNEAWVGFHGTGTVSITNGGTVNTGSLIMAAFVEATSTGTVTVKGATTLCNISGAAYVGGQASGAGGTALVEVADGGTVSAASIYVWGSGTLAGSGTISTTNGTTVDGTLAPKGGGTTLTIGGTLQLTDGSATQCNVTPQDPSSTQQVSVTGQVSLGGRLLVTMSGDFSSAPTRFTLLYADTFDVNRYKFGRTSITYPTSQCWYPVVTYDYTGGHVHVYIDRVYNCD
jgi:hypothetical protein